MALPSFLKSRRSEFPESGSAPLSQSSDLAASARRRLIGAAVLVSLGVIGFALLFETQPRPSASAKAPGSSTAGSVVATDSAGQRSASGVVASEPAMAASGAVIAPSVQSGSAAALSAAPAVLPIEPAASGPLQAATEVRSAPSREDARSTASASSTAPKVEAARATVAPSPKPPVAAEKPVARSTAAAAEPQAASTPVPRPAPGGRYAVQVGAYLDKAATESARQRVEKLGLKTFTQEVEVRGSRLIRLRVGPFASREQADSAVQVLKRGQLPGVVIAP
jgi:DedD protein